MAFPCGNRPFRIALPFFNTRDISYHNADFIGELGNAHFSFRQHDVDVNDDCMFVQTVGSFSDFIPTAFCNLRSNTAAAVAVMAETKIMKAPIMTPPAISSVPRIKMKI
jgi:hypothetical protein